MSCVFCEIVGGRAPASVVHEDEHTMAFMTLQPTAPGECLVIPRAHVDHFTDVDEAVAAHMLRVAHRIGRRLRAAFPVERVGYLVHGYGVAHAHLIIVPQQGPHHLTSDRFATIEGGRVVFTTANLARVERHQLDEHAARLRERPRGSERVGLRPIAESDAPAIFLAADSSRDTLSAWMEWCRTGYSMESASTWVSKAVRSAAAGTAQHFLVLVDDQVAGVVGFEAISPDRSESTLGYWIARPHTTSGVASAAVQRALHWGFGPGGLGSVVARIHPGNAASRRVAEKAGLRQVGEDLWVVERDPANRGQ